MPRSPRHRLAGCLLCATPALWILWPLLSMLDTAVPGLDPGDNLAALWNVWWFVENPGTAGWPYWTPLLFAPFGTQLSLHTHATTHSLLAWPWTTITSIVAAHNLAIATGLALNGACTFLLAFRATGRVLPAVAAGLLFSLGTHVQVRVLGHINLVHAWVLPLFAVALSYFNDRPGHRRALLLGASGALVMYTDYYYAIYAILLVILWIAAGLLTVGITREPPRRGTVSNILLLLLAVNLAVIVFVAATGGTALNVGPLRISLRGLRNPLTLFWLLLAVWFWRRYPVRAAVRWRDSGHTQAHWAPAVTAAVTLVGLTAPLWIALLDVIGSGGYTTQAVLWRSSPPGGDLLSTILGHPRHFLTGGLTTSAYSALGIDVMEQSLWVGLAPLVLLLLGPREWRDAPVARLWTLVAITFAVLALGPFLRIAGSDTAMPMPHALLRYLPFFSNARMPARALVMVQLAIAMLAALALAGRSPRTCAAFLVLFVLESLPAPVPLQRVAQPDAVDEVLSTSPVAGAVAELPTGLRDGFGEVGDFDHRAMAHQMHHRRPLAGGFVARLSPSVRRGYLNSPALNELLRVSADQADPAALAAVHATDAGIAFLVISRDAFPDGRLPRSALERAGFHFLQASGSRELYSTRTPEPHVR